MKTLWYEFQVWDAEREKFWTVGGEIDTLEIAKLERESFEYSRDKRTRKPKTRIVKFWVSSEEVTN